MGVFSTVAQDLCDFIFCPVATGFGEFAHFSVEKAHTPLEAATGAVPSLLGEPDSTTIPFCVLRRKCA
jgi:hypothetical protein